MGSYDKDSLIRSKDNGGWEEEEAGEGLVGGECGRVTRVIARRISFLSSLLNSIALCRIECMIGPNKMLSDEEEAV